MDAFGPTILDSSLVECLTYVCVMQCLNILNYATHTWVQGWVSMA
jgi:hypothetical protein